MRANSQRVVLASGNSGKLKELKALLSPLAMEVIPQSGLAVTEAEETGLSFVENAILKARHAAAATGLAAMADDSGIEVDALNGAPGIYSARYAGTHASDGDNLRKLLDDMAGLPAQQRQCRFHCLMVYMRHATDPTPVIAHGVWHGQLLTEARGEQGFGYDPIFWVADKGCSSAELEPETKNRLSHRGQALRELMGKLSSLHGR